MTAQAFLQALLEQAKGRGLADCEAYLSQTDSFRVSAYEGKVDEYSVSATQGVGFRALVDGRMGYAYSEVMDEEAIPMLLDGACESAALLEDDDPQLLFAGATSYPELPATYDEDLARLPAQDKIQMALDLEAAAKAASPKVRAVDGATVSSISGSVRIVNSRGLDLSDRSNLILAYLSPIVEERGRSYDVFGYRLSQRADLDIAGLAQETVQRTLARIDAAPVKSGVYTLILDPESMATLLETFASVFSARQVQKGLSLLRGKLGEAIASPVVTLLDNPHLPGGFASSAFDSEGVPTQKKAVIQKGVLTTYLHNLSTAQKDGMASTGNASRSFKGRVGVSPTNFYLQPGSKDLPALMAEVGEGILVQDLMGMHAGANAVSGDFSLLFKGFTIENGQLGRPVEQVTLAGNFFDFLRRITAVGSDLAFTLPGSGCFGSPSVVVPDVMVAGE